MFCATVMTRRANVIVSSRQYKRGSSFVIHDDTTKKWCSCTSDLFNVRDRKITAQVALWILKISHEWEKCSAWRKEVSVATKGSRRKPWRCTGECTCVSWHTCNSDNKECIFCHKDGFKGDCLLHRDSEKTILSTKLLEYSQSRKDHVFPIIKYICIKVLETFLP